MKAPSHAAAKSVAKQAASYKKFHKKFIIIFFLYFFFLLVFFFCSACANIVCRISIMNMIDLELFTYDSCQQKNKNEMVKCQLMICCYNWFWKVGCCGADGPNDYIILRQPLPIECRDTVTGHAFSNGCVDEMTWYLEDKSIWAAALAMSLAMIHVNMSLSLKINSHRFKLFSFFLLSNNFLQVVNAVLAIVLMQALRREEKTMYRK